MPPMVQVFLSVWNSDTYIDIKIPNNKGQKWNLFWGVNFQIYNTFFLHRLDSKESARQTDARYYSVNVITL